MQPESTISKLIETVSTGGPVRLVNDGSYSVDLVYVEDVVRCIVRALGTDATGIYNVGSGKSTSFAELLRSILALCDSMSEVVRVSAPQPAGFPALDITKAQQDFGYNPIDLGEGLSRMVGSRKQDVSPENDSADAVRTGSER
jgi:UDP-glucose 4-epimerase